MKVAKHFATNDPKAAMAAATVLVSATGGAGGGLYVLTGAHGPAAWSERRFLWWALVVGDAEAMQHLETADLARLGVVERDAGPLGEASELGAFAGGASHG